MHIEEMRAEKEMRQAIEESMQDMKRKPREPEFEDWTFLGDNHPQQEPLRDENWQAPSDLNPIFVDYDDQISEFSPPIVPATAAKSSSELLESPPEWLPAVSKSPMWTLSATPYVDSDSETEYSTDKP